MKPYLFPLVAMCGVLVDFGGLPLLAQVPQPAQTPIPAPLMDVTKASPSAAVPPFSSGLKDIARLAKAKVDESVILAFIQNSQVAYHPTAEEIIRLRDAGVSDSVITALVRRGAELRVQANERQRQAQTAAPAPSVTTQASAIPAPVYNPNVYPAASPPVIYPAYPTWRYDPWYSYSSWYYPYYSGWHPYSAYYPSYYRHGYPSVSFGVRVGGNRYGGNGGVHIGVSHFNHAPIARPSIGATHFGGGRGGGTHFSSGTRIGGARSAPVRSGGYRGGSRR